MKPIQKYIILIIGLSLFLLLGYIGFQNHDSSQLDELLHTEINTNTNSHINTPKSSPTLSDSGNVWGGNPFQTGTTNTGEATKPETPRLEFKKPNTEWKTRSLSGITYVFGEGNPKEVMPKLENLHGWDRGGYAQGETVRPITEQLLREFLSNPMLMKVMNQCGSFMKPRTSIATGLEVYLPNILFTTDFSINSMITIDPITGMKDLDREKFGLFAIIFNQIIFPVSEDPNIPWQIHLNCFDSNDMREYQKLVYQYIHINESWSNSSLENRKEVCGFLELKTCNYEH